MFTKHFFFSVPVLRFLLAVSWEDVRMGERAHLALRHLYRV